jgi:hypothetical protein
MKFRAALILTAITPALFVSHVGAAAQAWVESYNYKKLNNTYLVSVPVTQDAGDQLYTIQERTNNVKITAPSTNTGGNTREFFWPANGPDVMDSMSCAVWSNQLDSAGQPGGGITQQGAALRIVQTATGTRGITVTKNIWYAATWVFNVHVWDSGNTQQPYTQLAGFDMSEVVGKMWWDEQGQLQSNLKPFPWHVCARTIGDKFQFKVWADEPNQPSWNDPKYVREVVIPAEWNQPGKAGWYIGHLEPGYSAIFQGLQTQYR